MLYFDRIHISEGIDSTKSNRSKECMIYHYWFFNYEFKFQDSSGCHDLTIKTVFFTFFCFSIYKMVDSEYIMDIYKSVKIGIGTVMRNPGMLKFVPDHLKTKKMCKYAVKKNLFQQDMFLMNIRPNKCLIKLF